MALLLIIAFCLICVGGIIWGLLAKGRIYQFPFLGAATALGFIGTGFIGWYRSGGLTEPVLAKGALMGCLCMAATYWGARSAREPIGWLLLRVRPDVCVWIAAGMVALGAFAYHRLSRLDINPAEFGGLATRYLFFARALEYGSALALLVILRTNKYWLVFLLLPACWYFFDRVVVHARRKEAAAML